MHLTHSCCTLDLDLLKGNHLKYLHVTRKFVLKRDSRWNREKERARPYLSSWRKKRRTNLLITDRSKTAWTWSRKKSRQRRIDYKVKVLMKEKERRGTRYPSARRGVRVMTKKAMIISAGAKNKRQARSSRARNVTCVDVWCEEKCVRGEGDGGFVKRNACCWSL